MPARRSASRPASDKAAVDVAPLPPPPSAGESRARLWLAGGALILLTVIVYLPALNQGYIWDDDHYLTENPNLDSFEGLRRIWFEPKRSPQYYPLVFTTFWIEKRIWGDDAAGYHAVNAALHAVSVVLVWRILARLKVPGGWWAAALFAVHPVHVESVVWITERKNVLSGALYLAALLALLDGAARLDADAEGSGSRRSAWARFALAAVAFAGALLSKSVTATLPAAFLLLRWMQTGRVRGRDALVAAPLLVVGVAAGLHTAWFERTQVGAVGNEFDLSIVERLLLTCRTAWFYIQKDLVPYPVIFFYPKWTVSANDPIFWAFAIATVALFALLFLSLRRLGRGPLAGILFFAGTILPAAGLFNVYPFRYSYVADHFQYLASLGILATVVGLVAAFVERRRDVPGVRFAAIALGVVALATFGGLSIARIPAYRDERTLWETTVAQNPQSGGAWLNAGVERQEAGDLAGAVEAYERAIEFGPDYARAYANLALVELQRGDGERAIALLEKALEVDPTYETGWIAYGNVAFGQGDLEAARQRYERAAALRSTFQANFSLGNVAMARKEYADAARHYRAALDRDPLFLPAEADQARANLRRAEEESAAPGAAEP